MSLKYCANLSFMFQEVPDLLQRYVAAKTAGFKAVECAFPYDIPVEDVLKAKENVGLEQILINAPPGDWSQGDRGLAALKGREKEFKESIAKAIHYAKALSCTRVHVMAGVVETETKDNLSQYIANLKYAAKEFQDSGITGLIEPINQYAISHYFLNSYDRAISTLKEVNSPNLKLQLDLFHLQHISGNLTKRLQELLPYTGHIQIAQVPDRHEPDSEGEINYSYVFKQLEKLNYQGWIGLEYIPENKTEDGLGWINAMGYSL